MLSQNWFDKVDNFHEGFARVELNGSWKYLDRDGKFELIVNKPVTVTGKLFTNFRTYPQGEIHAMAWNGLGMELLWKTRRIKGTVCDVAVTDIDSNGKMDLVVAVNSYAGLGAGIKTRCGVIVYPLDTTMVSGKPNYSE